MDVVSSNRRVKPTNVVAAGSVWESRMKLDQVKGGFKVFNGEHKEEEDNTTTNNNNNNSSSSNNSVKRIVKKPTTPGISGKRKTWKSESIDGPIQIARAKKPDDQQIKTPIQDKKARSEVKKTPIQRKQRSELSKPDSDPVKVGTKDDKDSVFNEIKQDGQSQKGKLELDKVLNESGNEIETTPDEEIVESEENCREFGTVVCQETKEVTNNEDIVVIEDVEESEEEEEEEEEIDRLETDKNKTSDDDNDVVKEIIKIPEAEEQKPIKRTPKRVELNVPQQHKTDNNKVMNFRNRTAPTPSTVNKQPPPVLRRATIYQNLAKTSTPPSPPVAVNGYRSLTESRNKLQNLVDLVMWRDISRSAFVFGIGTFIIISSSYTNDLNVSCISVMSYMGLVYLASVFLYRSLICRGAINLDGDENCTTSYVVGEDEAIWVMKLILPYINECLSTIRALFSGDPSITMKMAVVLFVFARCGSSITIWKMAKLGFFGVFTVPKICSSYSTQLTAYGKFWIRRFRDAWESCTYKKAVALAIFTVVWNLSSNVARLWAVFMMFVAVRFYQQQMESEDWVDDDEVDDTTADASSQQNAAGQKQEFGSTSVASNKLKKGY